LGCAPPVVLPYHKHHKREYLNSFLNSPTPHTAQSRLKQHTTHPGRAQENLLEGREESEGIKERKATDNQATKQKQKQDKQVESKDTINETKRKEGIGRN
jgi:hypothetical protein